MQVDIHGGCSKMAIIEVMAKMLLKNSKTVVKTAKFKTLFLQFIKTRQLETWGKCKTTILVSFHAYGVSLHLS